MTAAFESVGYGLTEILAEQKGPGWLNVTVKTTEDKFEWWSFQLNLPQSTTIAAFKDALRRPPHGLPIDRSQKVLKRLGGAHQGHLGTMKENERVEAELILLGYRPAGEPAEASPRQVVGAKATAKPKSAKRPTKEELQAFENTKAAHAKLSPLQRRALSWCRTAAFAESIFKATGQSNDNMPGEGPFVMWILEAAEEVEGSLVENGHFDDVGFLDSGRPDGTGSRRVECYVMGKNLIPTEKDIPASMMAARPHTLVKKFSYNDDAAFASAPAPNLVLILCAEFSSTLTAGRSHLQVPKHVLQAAKGARAAFTMRFKMWEASLKKLADSMGTRLLFPPIRSPFSSQAGDKHAEYDDNGWVIGLQDVDALNQALKLDLRAPFPETKDPEDKLVAIFWGIIDLKYDPRLPILQRVKVLETGDGRSSKFSNHGVDIPKRFRARHRLDDNTVTGRFTVVSNNKKLTHDELVIAGYKHLLPQQLLLPRVYNVNLAQRIIEELGCGEKDVVILKLLNRSRAAGVIPVPVGELDEVLEEVLEIPQDIEEWMQRKLARGTAETLEVSWGSFEEQYRHFWSNECPFFVVENYCESIPVESEADGKLYDGTMRVAFCLRRKEVKAMPNRNLTNNAFYNYENPPQEEKYKEDLEIEWLGGYWKLPKEDVNSDMLRERIVSAARTKGTAATPLEHLHDIYAALGDSVIQLFSLAEPSVTALSQRYVKETPGLAAFLTARLAVTLRDLSRCRQAMGLAANQAQKVEEGFEKRCVESYVQRGYGVFDAMTPPGKWQDALGHFTASLELIPSNATSWYLKGMAFLELGRPAEAIDPMKRSLLLDLDFKAPYVNLCVALLRIAVRSQTPDADTYVDALDQAIEYAEALLIRHPDSPQCRYHIAVACFLKSQQLAEKADGVGANLSELEAQSYEELRKRASEEIILARDSDEAQRLQLRYPPLAPWLEEDDLMMHALRPNNSIFAKTLPNKRRPPPVVMPDNVGWRFFGWRT